MGGQEKDIDVKTNHDLIGLLKLIQTTCCNFEAKIKPYWALTGAKTHFDLFWKDINISIDKYRDVFEAYVETIQSYGGAMGYEKGHIKEKVKKIDRF